MTARRLFAFELTGRVDQAALRSALAECLASEKGPPLWFAADELPHRPLTSVAIMARLVEADAEENGPDRAGKLLVRLTRHGPERHFLTLAAPATLFGEAACERLMPAWARAYSQKIGRPGEEAALPKLLTLVGKYAGKRPHAAAASDLGIFPDRARPASPPTVAGHAVLILDGEVLAHASGKLSRLELTLDDWLLATWFTLLFRYGRQNELLVDVEPAHCVGASPETGKPFAVFAREIAEARHAAAEDKPSSPGARAGYCFRRAPVAGSFAGLRCVEVSLRQPALDLDLRLRAAVGESQVVLAIDYASELFDPATIERLLGQYALLLAATVEQPSTALGKLKLISSAERRQVVEDFNRTAADFPMRDTLHGLFEAQVLRTPLATALVFGDMTLSYQGFEAEANRLARRLRQLGVGRETLVGLCLDRGADMILAVYAILKAGGAYVPLDPHYPTERLAGMLADADLSFLVTSSTIAESLPRHHAQIIDVERDKEVIGAESPLPLSPNPEQDAGPNDLAYMIYTSGSTGRPKGVLVPHRTVVNFLHATKVTLDFKDDEVTLSANTISFDIVVPDLFLNFAFGGTLVLAPREASLDGGLVADLLAKHRVTNMLATPSTWRILLDSGWQGSKELRIIAAGEALPKPLARVLRDLGKSLWNGYGPTEITVIATYYQVDDFERPIFVGLPIHNTFVYILDELLEPVPLGFPGELYIGGAGVARGYWQRPELTAERFVKDPFNDACGGRMYKTGDLARFAEDGHVEYLGRNDDQVKIRGFRIELGDVEAALLLSPAVEKAVAMAREDFPGDVRLVVYYTTKSSAAVTPSELRALMAAKLPSHMVPNHLLAVPSIPLNANGKVDRKALPAPAVAAPTAYQAPRRGIEKELAALWATLLKVERVGVDDNFFELGGNSLLAVRMIQKLKLDHGYVIPVLKLFQFPTIAGLAKFYASGSDGPREVWTKRPEADAPSRRRSTALNEKIAVIGMACRFPGADTPEEFWRNLAGGKESIQFFNDQTLDPSISNELRRSSTYVKARGIIRDGDHFDAAFFGIAAREAEVMDPQHRQFLEICWATLEDAGYTAESYEGRIGVYAGTGTNTFFPEVVRPSPGLIDRAGAFQVMVANEKDYLTTRVMHRMNLKGPAVNVQTACSTSLVAVHLAVQALRLGECQLALAGGSSSTAPLASGYLYQEGGMLSPDGHTRSFDAAAQGTVFSDGVGAVLLKRLSDAIADGDNILAVIIGTAINNDGADKASFTAPSIDGQAEVIANALADAGVDAASISYVEAHGTATPLGDPIEVEALTKAFRQTTDQRGFCALGSVKSNVGHLTAAAGVAGLIKTALSLAHDELPPSLHFRAANPKLALDSSPFFVISERRPWAAGPKPRRAGISSFGVGGTNAHVVIEEAPGRAASAAGRPVQLLALSAKTEAALTAQRQRHAAFFAEGEGVLADAAFTLLAGRKAHAYRLVAVAADAAEASRVLAAPGDAWLKTAKAAAKEPAVVFVFPGQGSQYAGMGRDLYKKETVFRQAMDECFAGFAAVGLHGLKELLFASDDAASWLTETAWAQPALFAVEYSLARLWQSFGVKPDAMIGHSVGELVAAALAGVFELPEALAAVVARGRAMQSAPKGAMLAVRMAASGVEARLPSGLAIAAYNSPEMTVVSGETAAIQRFAESLGGVAHSLLHTSHAFHSPMMAGAAKDFYEHLAPLTLKPPSLPIYSTVTGLLLSAGEAQDPAYWSNQLVAPVRFAAAVQEALSRSDQLLLEVGPRQALTTLVRQQLPAERRGDAVASFGAVTTPESEQKSVLLALGQLWLHGLNLDANQIHADQPRRRVPLPTYPFERQRFWPPNPAKTSSVAASSKAPAKIQGDPALADRKSRLIAELKTLLGESSGISCHDAPGDAGFLELGLDSLFLTQFALKLRKKYGVNVTFRQLMEQYSSFETLASLLDGHLPPEPVNQAEAQAAGVNAPAPRPAPSMTSPLELTAQAFGSADGGLGGIVSAQLQIMAKQLELLSGRPAAPFSPALSRPAPEAPKPRELYDAKKAFGAAARITYTNDRSEITPAEAKALAEFVTRYCRKTKESKRLTQFHRPHLADPRVVTGFRPALKEVVYQIVVERSKGARLWDVDGNEYVDALCGFGMNYFGWSADFINDAVAAQMAKGMDIGPMTPLAGEVASLVCQMTGFDRAGFCNTGSEAVLGCMRVARTVTGRDKIVIFSGSYHGIFDEVLVRGTKSGKAIPAAPGIMAQTAENVVVLDYGTPESLAWIESHASELAAVMCEPIQSRRADFQPREYLHELRRVTERHGTALIFDEVITGFRLAPGGAQEYFGVKADLASYGKVIGGGFPIGIIAGAKAWADALDGGHWKFGDDSTPTVGVTYFAGTFVRHPPALAAAKAVLLHLKECGPALQHEMNRKTEAFATELNEYFGRQGIPLRLKYMGSLYRANFTEEMAFGDLFFTWMRYKGLHIWDGFPCFFTTAHTEEDIAFVSRTFRETVAEMQEVGLLPSNPSAARQRGSTPPVPGARLGRDPEGYPAWYIADPKEPGKFLKIK